MSSSTQDRVVTTCLLLLKALYMLTVGKVLSTSHFAHSEQGDITSCLISGLTLRKREYSVPP